jgi:hypothetical protein
MTQCHMMQTREVMDNFILTEHLESSSPSIVHIIAMCVKCMTFKMLVLRHPADIASQNRYSRPISMYIFKVRHRSLPEYTNYFF